MCTDPLAAMSTRPIPRRSAKASRGGRRWSPWSPPVRGPAPGPILVLVFALAQGVFVTGVVAVLAMAFGVAITTGALALRGGAWRGASRCGSPPPDTRSGILVLRALEVAAAALVLAAGLSLLIGAAGTGGA